MSPLMFTLLSSLMFLVNGVTLVTCGTYTVTEEAWFEVAVTDSKNPENDFRGRFTVALFGETAPMTVMNFLALVKGYRKRNKSVPTYFASMSYKNSPVHRIVPDLLIQMGDVTRADGTGGISIFGDRFNDENFALSHRSPGWVSMANHGPNTNASQFFILLTKARWLDGNHVVFGKVVRGFDVVNRVGEVPTNEETAWPLHRVKIVDCGVNALQKSYDLSESQLDSTRDLSSLHYHS